ncbi:hypothetical protein CWR48_06725 [Oceanobacillus arenosus]|uniref:Xaa-Pro dipeptidyl-peptidase C-terminal domain-containing protein n=1 Tax=Oceanobacillus arenosus TaxID=1229153 RepID=A0A3D8PXI8_9BACI|nr:CocE/NonD family hydrolase [Oceanobacillus arenosus]RDW19998.1 hypothetical protein CWR48_06725 [Oceanobacillus arenosus]
MTIQQIILEKNVTCTMRDGTILAADVYRPNKEGKFPVLITRLPYNKDLPYYSHRYLDTNRIVQHGYVIIIQDVRGRYASEGEFYPTLYEATDGYDTVEWAASLPYSSGKVGMFGLSYYGFTQLLAATERPPHLEAIAPAMTLNDWYANTIYHNGKFMLAGAETWALESAAPDLIKRKYKSKENQSEKLKQMAAFYDQLDEWFHYKPAKEWPPLKELGVADFFFDFLANEVEEVKLEKMRITDKYEQINVPAYHIAGWYDSLLKSTLDNYTELVSQQNTPQKLIIGPWGHGVFHATLGDRNFGIHASEDWIDLKDDLTALHIRWFDKWLKGAEQEEEAPIKLFVMGKDVWRDEYEWPLARTNYIPYYLHSNGRANTRFGDGELYTNKPEHQPSDIFHYDPEDPVPTFGGSSGSKAIGPIDQRMIEEREDVLVYTSARLEEELEVTGPIKVSIWVKTDAVDTDFTAKLIDVLPDGTAYNLTDGIVRLSHQVNEKIQDNIIHCEIELWPTSNVFLIGHRLRVEISSSNSPRFDANLNTGKTMIESAESVQAIQHVYHDAAHPSYILLPIV